MYDCQPKYKTPHYFQLIKKSLYDSFLKKNFLSLFLSFHLCTRKILFLIYIIIEKVMQENAQNTSETIKKDTLLTPEKIQEEQMNNNSNYLLSTQFSRFPRRRSTILQKKPGEKDLIEEIEKQKKEDNQEIIPEDVINKIFLLKKIQRVEQSPIFFILSITVILIMSTQIFYLFLSSWPQKGPYIFFPTVILRIIFFLIGSYDLCQNKKVLLKLFLCLDTSFMAVVANIVGVYGFIGVYEPYLDYPWVYYSQYALEPIRYILFLGYFRVMLVYCKWSVRQTVIIKLCLLIGACSHFAIGIFFIMNVTPENIEYTQEQYKLIKNFLILQSFSGFDLYLQLFGMMDDIDGTAAFKNTYKVECNDEDMQILYYGRKVRRNTKIFHRNNRLLNSRNVILYNGRKVSDGNLRRMFCDIQNLQL